MTTKERRSMTIEQLEAIEQTVRDLLDEAYKKVEEARKARIDALGHERPVDGSCPVDGEDARE